MMAAATSSKLTGRFRTAWRVVSPFCDDGWVPSRRIDPCCRKASPRRTCADPTSFRPPTRISPPTDIAKQDAGRSDGRTAGRCPASTASMPSNRNAAAIRVWISRYALRSEPKSAIGAATAYVTSCSCQTACPPVGRRTRSEEHTSELQSRLHLVCRLLLEKKKKIATTRHNETALLAQDETLHQDDQI